MNTGFKHYVTNLYAKIKLQNKLQYRSLFYKTKILLLFTMATLVFIIDVSQNN